MDNATVAALPLPSHPVFQGATFGILTDDNPRFPMTFWPWKLQKMLDSMGVTYEPVRGCYGGAPENSYIVYGMSRDDVALLGALYGQESVIFSEGGRNQLLFTNGPNAGRYHPGQGFTVFAQEPGDFYSTVQTEAGPVHFSLALDFDVLEHCTCPEHRRAA